MTTNPADLTDEELTAEQIDDIDKAVSDLMDRIHRAYRGEETTQETNERRKAKREFDRNCDLDAISRLCSMARRARSAEKRVGELEKENAELRQYHRSGRANYKKTANGCEICFGDHEKGESCNFIEFVHASQLATLRAGRDGIKSACLKTVKLRSTLFGGEPLTANEKQIVEHIAAAIRAIPEGEA